MTDSDRQADNEVVRSLFRKRDRIEVHPNDPFEDWAKHFYVDRARYYLHRGHRGRYALYTRRDHFSKRTDFEPDQLLLDTLWNMLDGLEVEQRERHKIVTRNAILSGTAP